MLFEVFMVFFFSQIFSSWITLTYTKITNIHRPQALETLRFALSENHFVKFLIRLKRQFNLKICACNVRGILISFQTRAAELL